MDYTIDTADSKQMLERLLGGLAGVISGLLAEAQLCFSRQPNHTLTPTHSNPRTIQPMW